MNKNLLIIPLILFFTSCATSYHRLGFFGDGYSEIVTNPDSFVVTFQGNEYTSHETALRYALLRASELTMSNGYNYFVVLSSKDQSSAYNYVTTHTDASGSASAKRDSDHAKAKVQESSSSTIYSGTVVKPATSIRIKCYIEKPSLDDAINAQFYWATNKDS